MADFANEVSAVKKVGKVQRQCPHCGKFKIISKKETAGFIFLGGLFTILLFGIGLIVMVVAVVYLIVIRFDYKCVSCGYEWKNEKK